MAKGVRWLRRLVVPLVCVGIAAALTVPVLAQAVSGTTLTIYKVNQANQPLAGASFVLLDSSETPAGTPPTVVTDATGHATLSGVAAGKYRLHEVSAPPGYSTSQDIGLEVGAEPAQQFVVDPFASGNGSLEIFKASSASLTTGLKGARFTATNEQSGAVFTLDYTDAAGFVTNFLPAGSYTVHETVPPLGYLPAADLRGVIVLPGNITDLTVLDTPGGSGVSASELSSLTIYKVNQLNQPLGGATFVLIAQGSNSPSEPVTTDASGHATFTGVIPGKYTLHETVAPVGYASSGDVGVDIGSSPAQQFVIDNFASGNGSIEIFKASSEAASVGLKGARFSATNEQSEQVFTLDYTDGNGFVTNFVPAGSYTLHEIVAPVGFFPASDIAHVIVFAGRITDLTILDAPGSGVGAGTTSSLTIYKVSPSNQPLAGATFVLIPQGSTVPSAPVTTDATGHATFTGVVPGKYTLHESSAPAGYVASADLGVDVGAGPAQQFVVDSLAPTTTLTGTGGATASSLPTTGGAYVPKLPLLLGWWMLSAGIVLIMRSSRRREWEGQGT